MPTPDVPWRARTPCRVDLAAPGLDAATAFHGPVLGWSFVDTGEFGHYTLAARRAVGRGDRAGAARAARNEPGALIWEDAHLTDAVAPDGTARHRLPSFMVSDVRRRAVAAASPTHRSCARHTGCSRCAGEGSGGGGPGRPGPAGAAEVGTGAGRESA